MSEYTEEQYLEHIRATLGQASLEPMPTVPLMNFVASQREWKRAKAALLRWIAEVDDDYDDLARTTEHEDD